MKKYREKRLLDVEIRSLENEEKMIIEGYPIVFNQPATHYGYTEIISTGACDGVDLSNIPLRFNHYDSCLTMASTKNGSLILTPDSIGLKMYCELPNTQNNRDVYTLIKDGVINKMSFAFLPETEEYDYDTNTRTIKKFKGIYDVSVVDEPFYEGTSLEARGVDNSKDFIENINNNKKKKLLIEIKKQELLRKL